MTIFINNPSQQSIDADRALIESLCKPHDIEPQSVVSITIDDVPERHYLIAYYNNNGHYCTIKVEG